MVAPRREPRVELQSLSENLANTIELDQGGDPSTSEPTVTTPVKSAHGTSRAHNSSWSTPPSTTLVPIARVQKLESLMANLLHHI